MRLWTTAEEREEQARLSGMPQFAIMMYAAVVAIAVNTLILKTAPLWGVKAGAGGLFGLLRKNFGGVFSDLGLSSLWSAAALPQPGTLLFYIFFHSLIGFVMAWLYVYIIEKYLAGRGVQKGAIFALLPWLLNSIIVLPLLGKGFAGSHVLNAVGLVYFFIANGVYGVLLGYMYERLTLRRL